MGVPTSVFYKKTNHLNCWRNFRHHIGNGNWSFFNILFLFIIWFFFLDLFFILFVSPPGFIFTAICMIRSDFLLVQFFKFWIFSVVGYPVLSTNCNYDLQKSYQNMREYFVYQFPDDKVS